MVWSLYKRDENSEGSIGEGLFSFSGELLAPMKFSNGKTQEDVVNEILGHIKNGKKMIFVKGVCGSGKSAMALNLTKHFKKTAVVVPIKSLQEQYEQDYTKKKFILKDNNNHLKISVIKGRNNFRCPFNGERADDASLPCCIELRDKNWEQIHEYLKETGNDDVSTLSDVRRGMVASACPYWSPILPADINMKNLDDVQKRKYISISDDKEYALFHRKRGCGYCDQYVSYVESDVLIFNAMKYMIETAMRRKPKTDLDIIDECDDFLDSFAMERRINLNRLLSALMNLYPNDAEQKEAMKSLVAKINDLIYEKHEDDVVKLKSDDFKNLFDLIMENPYLADDEENNYYNSVYEIVKSFEDLKDETYVSYAIKEGEKKEGLFGSSRNEDDTVFVDLVSINLAVKLKEIVDANNVMVLMSGTVHSENVLRDVFGLKDFVMVDAETQAPGKVHKQRLGFERNCKFSNFENGDITRKMYLKMLDACMVSAQPPTLVHVSSFSDLPSEEELKNFDLHNLISRERLAEMQSRGQSVIDEFVSGEEDVLFTTRCSRGVDFAGDKCRSIVITKYPYPNIQGLFWKILKKEQPQKFMEFYVDKARRELVQKIARGVRFKGDWVNLFSPDVRVLNEKVE